MGGPAGAQGLLVDQAVEHVGEGLGRGVGQGDAVGRSATTAGPPRHSPAEPAHRRWDRIRASSASTRAARRRRAAAGIGDIGRGGVATAASTRWDQGLGVGRLPAAPAVRRRRAARDRAGPLRSSVARPEASSSPRTSGCLATASRRTGSSGSPTRPARCWARIAAGAGRQGRAGRAVGDHAPAQQAGVDPAGQVWSGVTRAAVRPGVSSASRSSRAQATAASSSVRALITDRPFSPSSIGSRPGASARRRSIWASQSAVASAGRRASLTIRRRQRPRLSASGNQGRTSARVAPARPAGASSRLADAVRPGRPRSGPRRRRPGRRRGPAARPRLAAGGDYPQQAARWRAPCRSSRRRPARLAADSASH
jgi:hypothetical protein